MGGDRGDGGGGGGRGHGPPPGKLQVVIYFQAENWYKSPAPVGVVWICTRMSDGGILYFICYLPFLHVTGLAIILSSADAQADLRLCCLHATKSSFLQQGTYGMG